MAALGFIPRCARDRRRGEEKRAAATHNWLALVPEHFVHQKFISDLAGYDALDHDQTTQRIIQRVANWLQAQADFAPPSPKPKAVLDAYPKFCQLLADAKQQALGTLTWAAITAAAATVIADMPV